MEYKLKPAISKYKFFGIKLDKQQLFCLFLCAVLVVLFIQTYRITGSWWGPLYLWCKEMQLAWHEGALLGSFGIFLLGLGALFFIGGNIYNATMWRTIPLDEENKFESINFQPATFILQGPKPVVLPYDQTVMRLLIYITKQKTDDIFVKKVSMLSLCFIHQKDVYICNNFCGENGIFPLLEYVDRFASFSYEFNDTSFPKNKKIMPQGHAHLFQDRPSNIQDVQYYATLLQNHPTENGSIQESSSPTPIQPVPRLLNNRSKTDRHLVGYQNFVKEQIRKHLQTLSPKPSLSSLEVVDYWTLLICGTIFVGYALYHLIFTAPHEFLMWIFFLPITLFMCAIIVHRAIKLWHYYRIKNQLSQLEK